MSDAVALLAKMTAGLSDVEKRQLAQLLIGNDKPHQVDAKLERSVPNLPVKMPPKKTTITEDFRVIKDEPSTHKTPVRAGKNTFVDEGEGRDEDDVKLAYLPKSPTAKRPPVEFVDVICDRCRKTKSVSPSLATNYYICEKCAGGR